VSNFAPLAPSKAPPENEVPSVLGGAMPSPALITASGSAGASPFLRCVAFAGLHHGNGAGSEFPLLLAATGAPDGDTGAATFASLSSKYSPQLRLLAAAIAC
jgi:hypothetical protein